MDYDTTNVKNGIQLLTKEGNILITWLSQNLNNFKMENIARSLDVIALLKIFKGKNIDNLSLYNIKSFLEKVNELEDCPTNLLKPLEQNLAALILKINKIGERNLRLAKDKLLEKKDFSQDLKDLIEITYFEFTESLKNIEGFLTQKQADLKENIKKILPEILQILCTKIKEWYDIEAPSYIEESSNNILKDVTLKFATSPTSSKNKLKLSLKRKNSDDENSYDNSKILKTHDEDSDVNLEEYYKLMGESFSDSISA